MTDARLQRLARTAPDWFAPDSGREPIAGLARAPHTIWAHDGLAIRIWIGGDGRIRVGEDVPGVRLPECCAERHIQRDHSFCLGLRPLPVDADDEASVWWAHLGQYLQLQTIAALNRFWPAAHARDHGDAGTSQEAAMALAETLGLASDYADAYEGLRSWITDPALHLVDRRGEMINGRAPCPLGCRHPRKAARPIQRRKCPGRDRQAALVNLEQRRRRELAAYWADERAAGAVCCGKMDNCPLAGHQAKVTASASPAPPKHAGCRLWGR